MKVAYQGAFREVVWVPDESGIRRGETYWMSLPDQDRAKFSVFFERYCEAAVGIHDKSKFNYEGDDTYAFKYRAHRLFCYVDGRRTCITNGGKKKRRKVNSRDIEVSVRLRNYHLGSQS